MVSDFFNPASLRPGHYRKTEKYRMTEINPKRTLCKYSLANSFHIYIAVLLKVGHSLKPEIKQSLMLPTKVYIVLKKKA